MDSFLRAHWVTLADPEHAEFVRDPDLQIRILECTGRLEGDCDDAATLAGALLLVSQIPCRFVAIRLSEDIEFSHVFLRAMASDGGTLDIDPIVAESQLPIVNFAETMELILP